MHLLRLPLLLQDFPIAIITDLVRWHQHKSEMLQGHSNGSGQGEKSRQADLRVIEK